MSRNLLYPPIMDFISYQEESKRIRRAEQLARQDIIKDRQKWQKKVKNYETARNQ